MDIKKLINKVFIFGNLIMLFLSKDSDEKAIKVFKEVEVYITAFYICYIRPISDEIKMTGGLLGYSKVGELETEHMNKIILQIKNDFLTFINGIQYKMTKDCRRKYVNRMLEIKSHLNEPISIMRKDKELFLKNINIMKHTYDNIYDLYTLSFISSVFGKIGHKHIPVTFIESVIKRREGDIFENEDRLVKLYCRSVLDMDLFSLNDEPVLKNTTRNSKLMYFFKCPINGKYYIASNKEFTNDFHISDDRP